MNIFTFNDIWKEWLTVFSLSDLSAIAKTCKEGRRLTSRILLLRNIRLRKRTYNNWKADIVGFRFGRKFSHPVRRVTDMCCRNQDFWTFMNSVHIEVFKAHILRRYDFKYYIDTHVNLTVKNLPRSRSVNIPEKYTEQKFTKKSKWLKRYACRRSLVNRYNTGAFIT